MAYIIIIPLALLLLASFYRVLSLKQIEKQEHQKDDWQMREKNAEREAAYLRSAYNFYYDNYVRLSKQLEQLKAQLNRQNNTYNSCNNQNHRGGQICNEKIAS